VIILSSQVRYSDIREKASMIIRERDEASEEEQKKPETSENINTVYEFLREAERRMDTETWTIVIAIIKFGYGEEWEVMAIKAEEVLIKFCESGRLPIYEELIIYLELSEYNYRLAEEKKFNDEE